MASTSIPDIALDALRGSLAGRLITPQDADYDATRDGIFMGGDARPACIVRVADAQDVARAIRFAAEHGLELAIRSGGHSGAGHSATEGGLQVDLRDLVAVDIDPVTATVWAGTGLTAAGLGRILQPHDLVVGFGDTGSVGIGGITNGGGVGFLVRAHGLTIDNVLAAELVTADGQIRVVDAEHEPDLFWAVRGGGGNLGVVTRFRYQAHRVPRVLGGMLFLPATAATVAGFLAAADAAPGSVSTIANVMPAPPMPFLAPEHHGSLVIMAFIVCTDEGAAAEAALAPFRALAAPLADLVASIPYADLFPAEDHGGAGPVGVNRTFFMDRVDAADAQRIVERLLAKAQAGDSLMSVVQLRVLGGAADRVAADATAYAHRGRRIMGNVAALVMGQDAVAAQVPWIEGLVEELRDGTAAYVNFLGDEGPERVHDAYPGATWDRLADLKRRHDPANLFRRTHNVPPTQGVR